MSAYRPIVPTLVSAALLVAGCGSSSEPQPEAEQAPPPKQSDEQAAAGKPVATVKIEGTDFKLDPATVRVKKPGTVRFELDNAGDSPHALEVEGPKGEVETETITPGNSATVTADLSEPGTYTMYCPVGNHKGMGMTGKIVVAKGGGGGGAKEGGESSGGGGY